jgi:hypothetical protein
MDDRDRLEDVAVLQDVLHRTHRDLRTLQVQTYALHERVVRLEVRLRIYVSVAAGLGGLAGALLVGLLT